MKKEIIYLSYDGLLEPIGVSQIYNYLINLNINYKINLITFEKKIDLQNQAKIEILKKSLYKNDIKWIILKYHKTPSLIASLYDVIIGFLNCLLIIFKSKGINFIHIRGYFPGIIILPILFFTKIKLLFDIRGFWPDEKADRSNLNRKSFVYKFLIFLEKILLIKSKKIICLTNESVNLLILKYPFLNKKNFKIIPTCVDTNKFTISNKNPNSIIKKNKIVFCHLGSVDTAYDINKIFYFFSNILHLNVNLKLKIFSNKDINLDSIIIKYKIPKDSIIFKSINHDLINYELLKCDIGIFYLKNNYSIKASFPTKIGEFLSSGLPIICNDFNDDITNILTSNNIGLIHNFDNTNYLKIYNLILDLINKPDINKTCNTYAKKNLSLSGGVILLKEIYNEF